jgi:hypothetical protein
MYAEAHHSVVTRPTFPRNIRGLGHVDLEKELIFLN